VVGVYAKASSNSDAGTTGTSQILIVGQHNANPEHVQSDFALSGCIEALI